MELAEREKLLLLLEREMAARLSPGKNKK
jgi:hypothetical protein